MQFLFFLSVFFMSNFSFGHFGSESAWATSPVVEKNNAVPEWELEIKRRPPQKNVAQFNAPLDHHFNYQAPNEAETMTDGKWVKASLIEAKGGELVATWSGNVDYCHVKASLYICDNKNTYCIPKKKEISCQSKDAGLKAAGLGGAGSGSGEMSPTSMFGDFFIKDGLADDPKKHPNRRKEYQEGRNMGRDDGRSEADVRFIMNDSSLALSEARKLHKPLMIDFYGIWCPPCNKLDEMVFSGEAFSRVSRDFILLKLDADSPKSWDLKSKFKVKGYPTVIFASEKGEEISRIVGARDEDVFIAEMKKALKEKSNDLDQLKILADKNSNNTDAAFKLGLMYLDRGDFDSAHFYLTKASRGGLSTRPDLPNKLLSATLGQYATRAEASRESEKSSASKKYIELLVLSLEWYPHVSEAIDRGSELARVSDEAGDKGKDKDKESWKKGLLAQIKAAEYFLRHPKELKKMEATSADLFEIEGEAYTELGDQVKARHAFSVAAQDYLRSIKDEGLDENTERAFNLERIYCLWKSGEPDLAHEWYEKLEKVYPEEFTFYYQHAKLLQGQRKLDEGLVKASKAFQYSYGDNKLRVASVYAEILNSLNRRAEALKVLGDTLASATLPDDKSIRTHRYHSKLVALKTKLESQNPK